MTARPLEWFALVATIIACTLGQARAAETPEDIFWKSVKRNNDPVEYQLYIEQFPKGKYVGEARRRIAAKSTIVPVPTFKDCPDCPEMVVIPAGSFKMGSNENFFGNAEWDRLYKPVHTVRIAKPFALGKTEVTQGQWRSVMGNNPSFFSNCGDDCPVEDVSWNDAKTFIQRLNAKTGKIYRLPSEAEWEYACRAGGTHTYCGSDSVDSVAWYNGNSGSKTHTVAGKQANAWGLHDMSGNVWEWVEDCSNANYKGAPSDGSAWTSGNCRGRFIRGGSWYEHTQSTMSAVRSSTETTRRHTLVGFRLAKTLRQEAAQTIDAVQRIDAAPSVLEWAESDNGSDVSWAEAKAYCASKGSDWRLPTVAELQDSYKTGQPTPCGKWTCKVDSKSRLSGSWFWSSEPNGSSKAWGVLLTTGDRVAGHVAYKFIERALCVRRP